MHAVLFRAGGELGVNVEMTVYRGFRWHPPDDRPGASPNVRAESWTDQPGVLIKTMC